MKSNKHGRKGSAIVEFTIAGIPMIFLLFSTLQLAIGMWQYFTLDHAVNVAARYAAVHGATCTSGGNSCGVTVGNIATTLRNAATGVPSGLFNVTLTTDSGAQTTCNPLSTCLSTNTAWPPSSNTDNSVGKNVTVSARYNFPAALGMFWFHDGGVYFGPVVFPASSTQQILY